MRSQRILVALKVLGAMALAMVALATPSSSEATPLFEVKKLVASDAEAGHWFGVSVAVSGPDGEADTAVVGAHTGTGGGEPGAAYVVQRDGAGDWGEVKKLTASDAEADDWFGNGVAVSGDTAVVSAPMEDAGGSNAGAAYVFQRDQGGAGNWGQVKKLTASDAEAADFLGVTVALSGDTAVVGAPGEDIGDAGAAYVFGRDEGGPDNWGEVKKLTASAAEAGDWFGEKVAVSGDTAVVGAPGWAKSGAAYVFERDEGGADNWGEEKKLTASDAHAGDYFGRSVALDGDTAVVGALGEDSGGSSAGAVYVFGRDQGGAENWGEVKKLTASDAQAGDRFGGSVAVSSDTAVVGAYGEAGGIYAGAAYVFGRDEGGADNWGEVKKLTASDAQGDDRFGFSVAISGDIALVGAYWEDAGGIDAGAAYVFGPGPVGGIAELPDVDVAPLETTDSSGPSRGVIAGLAAAAIAVGGVAWYARRRCG